MTELSLVNLKSINKHNERIAEIEKRMLVLEQRLMENEKKNISLEFSLPQQEILLFIKICNFTKIFQIEERQYQNSERRPNCKIEGRWGILFRLYGKKLGH